MAMSEGKSDFEKKADNAGKGVQDAAQKVGDEAAKAYDEAKKTLVPEFKALGEWIKGGMKSEQPAQNETPAQSEPPKNDK